MTYRLHPKARNAIGFIVIAATTAALHGWWLTIESAVASWGLMILAPMLLAAAVLLTLSGRNVLRLAILVSAISVALLLEWKYWAGSGNVAASDLNEGLAFLALDGAYLLGSSVLAFWVGSLLRRSSNTSA